MRQFAALARLAGCSAALVCAACNGVRSDYERQIADLEQVVDEKNNRLVEQKATIDELHKQLDAARDVDPDGVKHLVYPEKLVIASLSGGSDYDGQPGDDGVTVYLQPVDRDGDVLKVAGEIRIKLFDLAAPERENLIGEYFVPPDEARKLWYGALMTSHFTVKCPWQHGPPSHPEITIRATFIDYLMKRVMTAQTTCTVKLPP